MDETISTRKLEDLLTEVVLGTYLPILKGIGMVALMNKIIMYSTKGTTYSYSITHAKCKIDARNIVKDGETKTQ